MCFQWMRKIYQYLRGRCAHRNRGYSNEISSHHSGSRGLSNLHGHGSFFCGGEGSVTYSRRPSFGQPIPTSSTYGIAGGYTCGGDGSIIIDNSNSGGTSGWSTAGGTVPVYGSGGGGSTCHSGTLGITEGGGSGYGYDASPRENALTGGGRGGSGYCSTGSGYGISGHSGPELSYGGGGSFQDMQQKCPVVIPNIKAQQSKQSSQWPHSQKK
ncbi:loricrin-like [Caloenas nicobarica]|uniref:loricrin-like n=1 Tax=Caloenas nicobarica TaxID=187106 RepID=UPI0032B87CAD